MSNPNDRPPVAPARTTIFGQSPTCVHPDALRPAPATGGKKLVPLDEHNAKVAQAAKREPAPNGIACPNCKKELVDTEPGKVTRTNGPSYTAAACPACGYMGIRYVADEQ